MKFKIWNFIRVNVFPEKLKLEHPYKPQQLPRTTAEDLKPTTRPCRKWEGESVHSPSYLSTLRSFFFLLFSSVFTHQDLEELFYPTWKINSTVPTLKDLPSEKGKIWKPQPYRAESNKVWVLTHQHICLYSNHSCALVLITVHSPILMRIFLSNPQDWLHGSNIEGPSLPRNGGSAGKGEHYLPLTNWSIVKNSLYWYLLC